MRSAMIAIALSLGFLGPVAARADDKDVAAVLDKAIKALGGEEKLPKAGTLTWKTKLTSTVGGREWSVKSNTSIQGSARRRVDVEGKVGDNEIKVSTIIDGKKGWRQSRGQVRSMDEAMLDIEKRRAYMEAAAMTIWPLKCPDFKVESAPDGEVDGVPVVILKAAGPDGKNFTLSFDKESGLPLKMTATVANSRGQDTVLEETYYSDFKDFGGVTRPAKIEIAGNGQTFARFEVLEYQVVEKPETDAFAEPK